jgi:3-methylcrotonyl-CoA carboxylase beta subunit
MESTTWRTSVSRVRADCRAVIPFATSVNGESEQFRRNAARVGELVATLRARYAVARAGGGEAMRARHRARGKLPVRERIDLLLDVRSPFLELSTLAAWGQYDDAVPAAGVVTGIGLVADQPCMLIANDATVKGGSFYHETIKKHVRAQEIAAEHRLPCIYLVDCGGAYLPEQDRVFPDKDHFGNAFLRQCRMSADGLPQIAAVFGSCTAGGAYIPALADEVVMVRGEARIHLGGPPIVKAAINEVVDAETLGGATMHTRVSGVSDYLARDERHAIQCVRDIVAKLRPPPGTCTVGPSVEPLYDAADIHGIVSDDPKVPYDVREIIARLVDASDFQEFKPEFGATLVCGMARLHGLPVGILGNNGVLFSESALKGAHFIELCNQRQIPLVFLQNITGYMVGVDAERGGIAKHSAKMVYAVATARVPRLTVIIGGSFGAGNYGMCGRGFGPQFVFAWPTSRIATMSADVAATVVTELRQRSIQRDGVSSEELADLVLRTREQFERQSDPYYATSRLWDDGLIEPTDTRQVLGLCLALANRIAPVTGPSPVYRM